MTFLLQLIWMKKSKRTDKQLFHKHIKTLMWSDCKNKVMKDDGDDDDDDDGDGQQKISELY